MTEVTSILDTDPEAKRLFDSIVEDLVEHLGVEKPNEITLDTTLESLGADSLDCIELLMMYEERLNVEIKDEEAEGVTTVGNILETVARLTAKPIDGTA